MTLSLNYHSPYPDGLWRRSLDIQHDFLSWCAREGVRGYYSEIGWPNRISSSGTVFSTADIPAWNALAEEWFKRADAAKAWAAVHCFDERQSFGGFWLTAYRSSGTVGSPVIPISQALDQAAVLEAHPTTANYERGINDATAASVQSGFSNNAIGTYNSDYWFSGQTSLNYIASRGIKHIRLQFRWERLQQTIGGALNATEVTRITDYLTRAATAGLKVTLSVHTSAEYHNWNGSSVDVLKIGSASLTQAHFADFWARMSNTFKTNSTVLGYELMNEPALVPASGGLDPRRAWESHTQAAVGAIRATGDTKVICVPGYFVRAGGVGSGQQWTLYHPTKWITDSANNHVYVTHQYLGRGGVGRFLYDDDVANYEAQGWYA